MFLSVCAVPNPKVDAVGNGERHDGITNVFVKSRIQRLEGNIDHNDNSGEL